MHRPNAPTTTNVSDLIAAMHKFTEENPLWHENTDMAHRMKAGYTILTKLCEPIHLTEDEYAFVMEIFTLCNESLSQ